MSLVGVLSVETGNSLAIHSSILRGKWLAIRTHAACHARTKQNVYLKSEAMEQHGIIPIQTRV
jgi:hypothetical protein